MNRPIRRVDRRNGVSVELLSPPLHFNRHTGRINGRIHTFDQSLLLRRSSNPTVSLLWQHEFNTGTKRRLCICPPYVWVIAR